MTANGRILGFLFLAVLAVAAMAYACLAKPAYISNVNILATIILAQFIIVSIWHYEKTFFIVLVVSFLLAGLNTSLLGAGQVLRWFVLGVGAAVGYIKWMKAHREPFGGLHLAALFCIFAALVSAMVSAMPQMALLKVLSLVLMFLYGAAGARLTIMLDPKKFMDGLVMGCEITAYATAACYYGLHYEIFGNPNSLGAVMGVVVVPVMFWSVLVADTRYIRQRRAVAFLLGLALLYTSMCRAGIIGGAVSVIITCLIMGRRKLLVQGAFYSVLALAAAGVLAPAEFEEFTSNLTTTMVYKGKQEQGLFGSRKTPWQNTVSVIQAHPWFGSGFGTSEIAPSASRVDFSKVYTIEETGREHGSSYLTMVEWLGLLGVLPFFTLLFFVLLNVGKVYAWMARTGSAFHYSIPIAMVMTAGLVHALFEDWLLAVGFYLTVFFWSLAFILDDLLPADRRVPAYQPWMQPQPSLAQNEPLPSVP
jgi:O-antigen ligase